MGRCRTRKTRNYPDNLYIDQKGYKYKHPISGKFKRLKTKSQIEAFKLAREANAHLAVYINTDQLTAMIASQETEIGDVADFFYDDQIAPSKKSDYTKDYFRKRLDDFTNFFGKERQINTLVLLEISKFLDSKTAYNPYKKMRECLANLFKFARAKGLMLTDNLAEQTLIRPEPTKVRKRHTLEGLMAIYHAAEPWLQRAILLALYTTQREVDIVNLKKTDVKNGRLFLTQEKSKGEQFDEPVRLSIKMGSGLQSVVKECLRSEIPSPYLIHYRPKKIRRDAKSKKHWTSVTTGYLQKRFSAARKAANPYPGYSTDEQPSFHEIRALSTWIYEKKLNFSHEYVQKLAGHSSGEMTTDYQEGHEIEYQEVAAEMSLKQLFNLNGSAGSD